AIGNSCARPILSNLEAAPAWSAGRDLGPSVKAFSCHDGQGPRIETLDDSKWQDQPAETTATAPGLYAQLPMPSSQPSSQLQKCCYGIRASHRPAPRFRPPSR